MKRLFLSGVGALAVVVLLPFSVEALSLPVATVEPARETCLRRYPGVVTAVAKVDVVPQVSGEIVEVAFQNGQQVKKGDVLYRLDDVKYRGAVQAAEGRLAEARATYAYAKKAADRYADLIKTRAVSQDDFERACSVRDTSLATITVAESELLVAHDDLRHCTISASLDGRVGSTQFTAGNYMQKGGATMVNLVQTSPIRVHFRVSSVDYRDFFASRPDRIVREGLPEIRLVSGDAAVITGRVEYVDNVANRDSDTVGVYALVDNADGQLHDGQTVVVDFTSRGERERPSVPPHAIAQDVRGTYVWVLDANGVAEQRYIARGLLSGGRQLVLEGLRCGERIVADGVHRVKPGMVIEGERCE